MVVFLCFFPSCLGLNILWVILHKLQQGNKYLFVYGFKTESEKRLRTKQGERTFFLEIFIYFQLLSMFCRCDVRVPDETSAKDKNHCYFISFYGPLTRFFCLTLHKSNLHSRDFSPPFMTFRGHKNCEFAIFFMTTHLTGSRYIMKLCLAGWKESVKSFLFTQKIASLYGLFILIIILGGSKAETVVGFTAEQFIKRT